MLLTQHPNLLLNTAKEIARLKTNLEVLKNLKDDDPAKVWEIPDSGGADIVLYNQTLTNIKRLRLKLESDFDNETVLYNEALEKAQKIYA